MKVKRNTLKEQRTAAELELIIEDFGRAMRNASKDYIVRQPVCSHESSIRFTPAMEYKWNRYVEFCMRNPA